MTETPRTDEADDVTMRFSARHERLKTLCQQLEADLSRVRAELEAALEAVRDAGKYGVLPSGHKCYWQTAHAPIIALANKERT